MLTEKTTTLETVKKAITAFEKTQADLRDFGAGDSEPDGVWQRLLYNALEGKAPTPPRTGDGWELYTSTMDCSAAATALFEKALTAIQAIESCPIRDIEPLREYLEDYCWRAH